MKYSLYQYKRMTGNRIRRINTSEQACCRISGRRRRALVVAAVEVEVSGSGTIHNGP